MEDVTEEVFSRFLQFAYAGDYTGVATSTVAIEITASGVKTSSEVNPSSCRYKWVSTKHSRYFSCEHYSGIHTFAGIQFPDHNAFGGADLESEALKEAALFLHIEVYIFAER